MYYGTLLNQQLANGFMWAWKNGADVISNSWGGIDMYPVNFLSEAIDSAVTRGRW